MLNWGEKEIWIAVLVLSFFLCVVFIPILIKYTIKYKISNSVKPYLPVNHQTKLRTPNMGGIVIVLSILTSSVLFCNFSGVEYYVTLFTLIGFAFIGLYDDLAKMYSGAKKGISEKRKFIFQVLVAAIACFTLRYFSSEYTTFCYLPFTSYLLDLGYFYDFFCVFVICGTSNAVNITDGLDGLAILPICVSAGALVYLISTVSTSIIYNSLSIICFAIIGSGLGFFIYNRHPAKIFMGDTGSLPLGATLGIISVVTKNQFFLAIIGGVFVIEALSVIMQVLYRTVYPGEKLFRMAPIHHHFEQLGISETKITKGFWIASLLFAALGLSGRLFAIQ
jgi:phospho-N-acetylmuramoyl-pentapeptide-transferase